MSTLKVNEIRAASGTTVAIPVGYSLSLAGTILNTSSMIPTYSGSGKFLVSDGTNVSWQSVGPASMQIGRAHV